MSRKDRREADRARRAAVVTTGHMPAMLQDCDRKFSQWLAGQPDAMQRAREAAAEITSTRPADAGPTP